jgi:phage N-6-adenine-methyltransferase
MSENADVIQGRLGWESGDVSEANVANLEPHPKNDELYGDTAELAETFVESVREKGVLEPLVITSDKQVISGHRRLSAAKEVGIESVPVRISEFNTELAEREALIEFNRQREKTPGQIVNEFEEMLAIEKERAKENMSKGGKGERVGNVSNPSDDEPTAARDKAAEKVNADVSGRTLEKGKNVKDKAESDEEPEEVQEAAQEAWEGLQSGDESFNSAHEKVKNAEEKTVEDESETDIDVFTSDETDEWSSPREIVEPLRNAIGGFDLDPCSGAESSPFADATFTESEDGLSQPWHGSVWVNPPYSNVAEWTDKAIDAVENGDADCIFYLCKGDSSTNWWQRGAKAATTIVAIDHRLKFGDGENSAPFASHILIFGNPPTDALHTCAEYGILLSELGGGFSE